MTQRTRTKFLTDKQVQLRLASVFLLWFAVYAVASISLYFISYHFAAQRIESLGLQQELETKALVIEQSERLAMGYAFVTLIYLILVWIYMLVYSNHITGPIFKLNRILDESIKSQTWPQEVKFRKNDAFRDLADKFNACIKIWKDKKN